MNNLPVRFLSVTIKNFRGVPDTLKVPLDAPLTVIHAANGTGKSTICYALEWLLTSKVADLPNTTDFSCQWGEGDTSVTATCLINEDHHKLERINGKAWITKQGLKKKQIKDADLLALLTPASVVGSSPQATMKSRRYWLRNCRWLYANSLALLVDNSESEKRQQIFADILGLGHLTSTLNELKEYRAELPSTRGLENRLEALKAEIQDIRVKIATSMAGREHIATELSSILNDFQGLPFTGKIQQDFDTARLEVTKLQKRTQHNKNVLSLIAEVWPEYESSLQQREISRNLLIAAAQATQVMNNEHQQFAEQLSAFEIKFAEGKRSVDWAAQKLSILKNWSAIRHEPAVSQYFAEENFSFQRLKQSFAEFSWEPDKQRVWLSSIEYLIQNDKVLVELVQHKKALLDSPVYPPLNIEKIVKLADDAKQIRVKAQAEFDAYSNIFERLKALGNEAAHTFDSTHCPLCDHDWETRDKLQKQLSVAHISPELKAASTRLAEAQSTEQSSALNVKNANLQKLSSDAYLARLQSVNAELDAINNRTNYLQIMNKADFSDFNPSHLSTLLARIKAAIGIVNVVDALTEIENFIQLPHSQDDIAKISNAIQKLEQYQEHFQAQIDSSKTSKLEIGHLVNDRLEQIKAKTRESQQLNAGIAASSEIINRFETQWKDVVGASSISKEQYELTLAKVNTQLEKTEVYNDRLRECEAVLAIDSYSEQLTKLTEESAILAKKLDAGQERIGIAEATVSQYATYVRDVTVSSLSPLLGPATELFSRMHANEVYHQLSVSGEDLNWMVFAEGHESPLEAQDKLSQGQRQDLALSLYLARAKNTGGSFLLDEPIAHLDDLNRVAMLDIFRLVASSMPNVNLILTTASDTLARHLAHKFSSIQDLKLLNTIYLEGNPRTGVKAFVNKITAHSLEA